MTIHASKMGPGTLLLGSEPLDISAQCTKGIVNPSEKVEEGETIPVLDGTSLVDDDDVSFTYTLDVTLLQDLRDVGVVNWSWDNAGTWQPVVFVPNNADERGVSGEVRVVPIAIGGDVKKRNTSDLSWKLRGSVTEPAPIFGTYDPVEDVVEEDV